MADDINFVGEEENDSKDAADIVDSWVSSMMKKLDPNHCKFPPFIICKVPRHIRKDDPGAYTPMIVSIGPFHRREKNVQAMEELKMHYLNNILPSDVGQKERHLKKYLEEMKAIEPWVRTCYSEKMEKIDPQEFVEMMVVDGCFLIQLLFQERRDIKKDDPIHNNYWRLPLIRNDILLLENQLPFVVLEKLCPLLGKEKDTLWKRALDFYRHLFTKEDDVERKKPKEAAVERKKPEQIFHLLHLIHMFFRPAASAPHQNSPGRSSTPPNQESLQTTVCGSASISALTMGRRPPIPPGEQSSQEIKYTVSRQEFSLEVPLIDASTPIGSAPTHSMTTDSMTPTPPGEQTMQEALQTLSGEQSLLEYIRSDLQGSAAIYPITRPPASQGSNIFSETLAGSSPIHPRTKRPTPLAGSARINPKTYSQELQHTQSDQRSFEYVRFKNNIAEPLLRPSARAHRVTAHLWHPIPPGEQSFEGPRMSTSAHADPPTRDLGPLVEDSGKKPPPKTPIPSATELLEAGVTFQLKKADSFLDVTFKQGKLEMPCLGIDDGTNSLFRNFIAFEQCFPCCGSHFTKYCFFMDSLVNTAKDVQILSRKDVIENLLGSDKEVARLFNKLCRGVVINFHDSYLAQEFKNINKHTKETWWPKQRAKLMRDYFSNPWSMLSVAAASLIILLTLFQTFFTVFAYIRPPKS